MEKYYCNTEYIMLIDKDQSNRIDRAIRYHDSASSPYYKKRPSEYWSDASKRFLSKYNARFGSEVKSYNPFVWRKELIFNTEQDAVMFCLKVF